MSKILGFGSVLIAASLLRVPLSAVLWFLDRLTDHCRRQLGFRLVRSL
jgi:hypothetical protein